MNAPVPSLQALSAPPDETTQNRGAVGLQPFVFGLFFVFGGITSLNDVLIPKLKGLFTLSYGEAMLVQSAFFAAYFLISLPAAAVVRRIGYLRTAALGLITMTAGCLLFVPASELGLFSAFLIALFVLAAGITTVQVVANPLISMLGRPATVSSRLTFAQGFNSLGTTVFPYFGAILILRQLSGPGGTGLTGLALDAFRSRQTLVIATAYLVLAAALAVVAALVWQKRNILQQPADTQTRAWSGFALLARMRFGVGALCIFLYVGAEVAIGSLIVNYLMQPSVLALSQEAAGKAIPLYWGGALVGRLVGAYLLRLVLPGYMLAAAAGLAMLLAAVSAVTHGATSGYSLLAIGLFNSIMFPTIFSLACQGLGKRTAEGSGLLCMAIVGGAVIPPLTGHLADLSGLRMALALPVLCYTVILAYGLLIARKEA